MKFHPFSEIFPLIEGAEFAALVDDIKAQGLREKIWLYDGKILDGRNRYLACQKAKVKPLYRKFTGKDALAFVVSLNIARRHLTIEQRAFAGARIANMQRGENQHTARAATSQKEIAEQLGISADSIQRAKRVIASGSKALQQAAEAGDVPLRKASAVVDLPKSEQIAAATQKAERPAEPLETDILSDRWTPDEDEGEKIALIEKELADSLDKVMAADDKLAAAHAEIKRQAAEIAVLKLSRDGFMNGKTVVTKLLKAEQRKSEKLTRQVQQVESELEKLRERISIMEAA
jgi:hypothetical protein